MVQECADYCNCSNGNNWSRNGRGYHEGQFSMVQYKQLAEVAL